MPRVHTGHVELAADRGDHPGVPRNPLESHQAPQCGAPATRRHNTPVAFTRPQNQGQFTPSQPPTPQPAPFFNSRLPQPPPRTSPTPRDTLARTTHDTTVSSSHYSVSTNALSTYVEPLLPRLLLQLWFQPRAPSASDKVMEWLETVEDVPVNQELEYTQRGRRDALSRIRELEARQEVRRVEKK